MVRPILPELIALIREVGPGGKLPGERELCQRLGLSRPSLRDHLQMLVGLGVLQRQQGAGTYVQRLDPSRLTQALDLALSALELSERDLEGVRIGLERQAAIEAAIRRDEAALSELAKPLAIITHSTSDELVDAADWEFHYGLMAASGNEALVFFITALSGVLHPLLSKRLATMREVEGARESMIDTHTRIYDALLSGDPEAAAAAIDYHFAQYRVLFAAAETVAS